MKPLGLNEIREKYLEFFEKKGHLRLKSFPLVPINDKSLLLINSGMAPLKPYFTGQEIPPRNRVTTCQKCIRTNDIENVGYTSRHGTFFEMLGNFSFGDYFKEEIIPWAWEFLTEVLEIPEEKLFISVYEEDEEAYEIWNKKVKIPKEKIFRMGKEDNFWEVGLGPCGPSSEIYFDKGDVGCTNENCTVGCDCDRYMEIWNLVFTQFNKEEDGSYSRLKSTNIDTGMGLDRMATAMQGVGSLFDVDTMAAVRDKVCKIAGVEYNTDHKKDISIRIITDHVRAVTFMTADGVLPSNEGRGYVLRRLLRRAARHGKLLGIQSTFLVDISKVVIEVSKNAYPELLDKQDYIFKVLSVEEDRFYETLDLGIELLKSQIDKLRAQFRNEMVGNEAFKLYDTYGFPLELMKEMLEEEGLSLDEASFNEEMEKQKSRARQAREESTYMGASDTIYNKLPVSEHTEHLPYLVTGMSDAKITTIICNNEIVNECKKGDEVSVILNKTPLYAESGGQKGDKGTIKTKTGEISVKDCLKVSGNKIAHIATVIEGSLKVGDEVTVSVDLRNRLSTARNHTATHLLQKALREVLGSHIEQAGSSVSSDRLRFDFTHFSALSQEEIRKVQAIVNEKILESLNVSVKEMDIEEARKMGAMALFGEKYGKTVRVVNISGYSIEFCGGTHLNNTSQVGIFKIISETGIASGVRRIEAITGEAALHFYNEQDENIQKISNLIKVSPDSIVKKIEFVVSNIKELTGELNKLRSKMSVNVIDDLIKKSEKMKDVSVLIAKMDDLDTNSLRMMGDQIRDKMKNGVVVLISAKEDKVNLIAMATEEAVKAGINCGNIIKEAATACGGGGGGKPNMAQAGGKDVSKIQNAIEAAKEMVIRQL